MPHGLSRRFTTGFFLLILAVLVGWTAHAQDLEKLRAANHR